MFGDKIAYHREEEEEEEADALAPTAASGGACDNDDDDIFPLPGFRFHPTDEELVGFYLLKKVQKKPIKIDIIKQVDIYQFDPWDIPRSSETENESYFFCKRGRKYRNSIRPNRVTGSGFWKATGIDKSVYSDNNIRTGGDQSSDIIGLKKTLVYYRGSAGKGTKTEWMMHEFRLPTNNYSDQNPNSMSLTQEAEVWTLCRIFKRNVASRKYTPDWREVGSSKRIKQYQPNHSPSSWTNSSSPRQEAYISFGDMDSTKSLSIPPRHIEHDRNVLHVYHQSSILPHHQPPTPSLESSSITTLPYDSILPEFSNVLIQDRDQDQSISYNNWDELRSVFDLAFDP